LPTWPIVDLSLRIDDHARLLVGTDRSLAPRQRTVDALVEWSYSLLTPKAQRLLRELSVFRSTISRAAIMAVASDVDDVDDALSELVDKSLVLLENDLQWPYRLLFIIREFAASRLCQEPDVTDVRSRHAQWCATETDPDRLRLLFREDIDLLMVRGDQLLPDVEAAAAFAEQWGDGELLARLIGPLAVYFTARGHRAAWRWLEQAAALATEPATTARCLARLAHRAFDLDNLDESHELATRALRLAEDHGLHAEIERAHVELGTVEAWRGNGPAARHHLEPLLRSASPTLRCEAKVHLGIAAFFEGDLDTAERWYREVIDDHPTAVKLLEAEGNLAEVLMERGQYDEAEAILLRIVEPVRRSLTHVLPTMCDWLAKVATARRDYAAAHAWLTEGVAAANTLGRAADATRLTDQIAALPS
jgi:tetratricopeptide (TPR) repeat protein